MEMVVLHAKHALKMLHRTLAAQTSQTVNVSLDIQELIVFLAFKELTSRNLVRLHVQSVQLANIPCYWQHLVNLHASCVRAVPIRILFDDSVNVLQALILSPNLTESAHRVQSAILRNRRAILCAMKHAVHMRLLCWEQSRCKIAFATLVTREEHLGSVWHVSPAPSNLMPGTTRIAQNAVKANIQRAREQLRVKIATITT